jgi:hypothetical protein
MFEGADEVAHSAASLFSNYLAAAGSLELRRFGRN